MDKKKCFELLKKIKDMSLKLCEGEPEEKVEDLVRIYLNANAVKLQLEKTND